ncbi:outer membrane beta-barrel protein [Mangrovimonas aestuarii]|uniref:outer membrane beta-barrel protein n=1 Tax=Mangrovimonas aestuarii TaxID=3018443 RepID=UPI002378400B|nr:hypothetical protein [Mangrovimonas aestuarii]
MNDKKHIDRLFKEQFKNFEAKPSDKVWDNIQKELGNDKRKKRIVPIWWRYAGVAALLLLSLIIGSRFSFNSVENNPTIVNSQEEQINPSIKQKEDSKIDFKERQTHSQPEPINSVLNQIKSDPHKNSGFNQNNALASTKINKSEKNTAENQLPNLISTSYLTTHPFSFNSPLPNSNLTIENTETEELTIEEAIAQTDNTIKESKDYLRWQVSPNVAPVYFNTLGKGSSIDPQFNENKKQGDVNMSYGFKASYSITDKLSIRSGINNVALGYNTTNVYVYDALSRSPQSQELQNVSTSRDQVSVTSSSSFASNEATAFKEEVQGSIDQQMGFLEIPLELEYKLSERRLGVNLIGGFSSLFLNKNSIYTEVSGSRDYLGEANNINQTSYSANLGLGLDYKFSKRFKLNLEPTFKYQLNTFKNTSGDFKPYFLGVYTGFSFKF